MTKVNRNLIIAIAALVVAVLVVAGVIFFRGQGKGDDPVAQQPAESSTTAPTTPEKNFPGAMVGNKQRTWPDPEQRFDDSPHAKPGTYSADWMKQQPVWTPRNHDGDLPKKDSLKEGMNKCSKGEVNLEGKTQQQYVNARYLVVNDQAGPSRLDKGVPRGYAHSPQGAGVAAMNLFSYGIYAQGDGIGEQIDKELWSTSKKAQEDRKFFRLDSFDEEARQESRAQLQAGADSFNIKTCSPDLVVVEVAFKTPEISGSVQKPEDNVFRVPMFWRDGDWKPDFSGSADKQMTVHGADLNTFTEVKYS